VEPWYGPGRLLEGREQTLLMAIFLSRSYYIFNTRFHCWSRPPWVLNVSETGGPNHKRSRNTAITKKHINTIVPLSPSEARNLYITLLSSNFVFGNLHSYFYTMLVWALEIICLFASGACCVNTLWITHTAWVHGMGGIRGNAPTNFLLPPNLIVSRKICFKIIIKTNILLPKCVFCPPTP